MRGRMVYLDTGWQTVSAVQDLAEIKMGSGQFGILHSVMVAVSSEETDSNEFLQINTKRATGSFTSGSGGGSLTVVKGVTNDAAHGLATVERNNTTQAAAGSGALENLPLLCGTLNVLACEFEKTPPPELRVPLLATEAVVVSLDEAPADAITMRCVVALEVFG